jgi:hypothetical protein
MALIDTSDVYGYTLFCDDIRFEANGTRTLVGMYVSPMFIHANFPVTLPKFGFAITLLQRKDVFNPNVAIRIFLPGDSDEHASIQAALGEPTPGAIKNELDKGQIPEVIGERLYVAMRGNFIFAPFPIQVAGTIKVRAVIGDNIYRLGSMTLYNPAVQEPPKPA